MSALYAALTDLAAARDERNEAMRNHSYTTSIELVINGHSCETDVSISYEYEQAGGDGWNEPRYPDRATLIEVECWYVGAGNLQLRMDILPLLSKDVISALEADCCKHEADEREVRASEYAEWKRETTWEVL